MVGQASVVGQASMVGQGLLAGQEPPHLADVGAEGLEPQPAVPG